MAKQNEEKMSKGLWIREEILNNRVLSDSEKRLLAHFDSFGANGCYQANDTLAKICLTEPRTIRRRIAKIKKAGLIYIKSPNGYYRTIWVKSNPKVVEATKLWYRGKEIDKPDGQKWPTKVDKSGQPSGSKSVFRHGRNCPTTNKYKDTNTHRENKERAHNNISSEENAHKNCKHTLEKVIAVAHKLGIRETMAKEFFHYYDSQNWLKKSGLPITNLESALENWRNRQHLFGSSIYESPPVSRDKQGRTPLQRYYADQKKEANKNND